MSERLTDAETEVLEARLRSAQRSLAHLKEDLGTLTGLFAPQVEADALRRENERLQALTASQSQQVSDALRWIARATEALQRIASGEPGRVGTAPDAPYATVYCDMAEAARWGLGERDQAPWEDEDGS